MGVSGRDLHTPSTWVSGASVWQSANPCKRGFDPCKWIFRADRVWVRGRGRALAGSTLGHQRRGRAWFVYIDKARRNLTAPSNI